MGFSVSQQPGHRDGERPLCSPAQQRHDPDRGCAFGGGARTWPHIRTLGALGILHRNADATRSRQPSAFRFPRPWRDVVTPLCLPSARRNVASLSDDGERDVDWVCGSFLLMRRECLERVGPLDERFFAYDEDIDWCRRAWEAGWKVRFWPGASMIHVGGAARPFMKDKTFVHFRSRLSYIRKHHTWIPASLYLRVHGGPTVARDGVAGASMARWQSAPGRCARALVPSDAVRAAAARTNGG